MNSQHGFFSAAMEQRWFSVQEGGCIKNTGSKAFSLRLHDRATLEWCHYFDSADESSLCLSRGRSKLYKWQPPTRSGYHADSIGLIAVFV